jgi:chromate transporter
MMRITIKWGADCGQEEPLVAPQLPGYANFYRAWPFPTAIRPYSNVGMQNSGGRVPISHLRLFLTSLKLGLVGFGGGMAVLSLLHREFVVQRRTCDEECFLNAAALSQALPGAISFNAMSFLGLSMCGFWGATLASWGFMLPSFLIMIGLSMAYDRVSSLGAVNAMLHGMVAGVVGLILAVAWELAGKGATRCRRGWVIVLVAFVASLLRVGVVEIILGCGVAGMFLCASRGD